MRAKIKTEKGFTIIEVMIAVSVLAIGLLGVSSMQVSSMWGNAFARQQTEGATIALDRMEKLMSLSYDNTELDAGSHSDLSPPNGYSVVWEVENNSPLDNTKRVIVTVTWINHGVQKNVSVERFVPRII
jgi:prepilin-type N-terminal cleavage/methylation domain-containing protein